MTRTYMLSVSLGVLVALAACGKDSSLALGGDRLLRHPRPIPGDHAIRGSTRLSGECVGSGCVVVGVGRAR